MFNVSITSLSLPISSGFNETKYEPGTTLSSGCSLVRLSDASGVGDGNIEPARATSTPDDTNFGWELSTHMALASGWLPSSQTSSALLTVRGSEPSIHIPSILGSVASAHTTTVGVDVCSGVGVAVGVTSGVGVAESVGTPAEASSPVTAPSSSAGTQPSGSNSLSDHHHHYQ